MMRRNIRILCIHTGERTYAPLAWTDREISNKKLRRLVRKFRTDADFLSGAVLDWNRMFDSLAEVKRLPYV